MDKFAVLLRSFAGAYLVGFVGSWLWIAFKLHGFQPADATPKLILSPAFANLVGALATTLGAGTAVVLGIKVQQSIVNRDAKPFKERLWGRLSNSPLLLSGVIAYFVIGVLVIAVWVKYETVAPDAVHSFATEALAWMSAVVVAVFAVPEN